MLNSTMFTQALLLIGTLASVINNLKPTLWNEAIQDRHGAFKSHSSTAVEHHGIVYLTPSNSSLHRIQRPKYLNNTSNHESLLL